MISRHWFFTCFLALLGAGTTAAFAQNPCNVNPAKVMQEIKNPHNDLTLLAAHRGIHALFDTMLYRSTPENSLQAIQNAAQECIEIVELDIRLTKDGVPVLSHDSTWGRETNVGDHFGDRQLYDPWINVGPNPPVNSWTLRSIQEDNGGILLRNSVDFAWSKWYERPPTLQMALDFITANKMKLVLALDVKDPAALDAAWNVIARNGFYQVTFFKIDAGLWPNPNSVDLFFKDRSYVCKCSTKDDRYVNIMPIFNTSNIAPNNGFGYEGGEGKVWGAVSEYLLYHSWRWYMGVEINIKQPGGILDSTHDMVRSWLGSASKGGLAIFNPRREYVGADGSSQYYNSDGRCCSKLQAYWFDGRPHGLPSDTADLRPDWTFIFDDKHFTLITSDNVLQLRTELQQRKRRNISRIRN